MIDQRLSPGEIVIGDLLGQGGFGSVYKATQHPLSVPLSIKIFNPSVFNNYNIGLERFYQEAEILMTLRHPNIVAVYGFGEHELGPYILMENFTGHNLECAVSNFARPLPSMVLPFVLKACDAFHHAHSHSHKPVIHRDIKPSNLMTVAGDMRVLDFGLAKKLIPEEEALTIEGQTFMGGAFSDPTLIDRPRLVDARSDIYGLGACWYYALTGTSPSGSNVTEQLKSIDGMTREYEAVVMKCLTSLSKRYDTMLELKNEIAALMEHGTPTATLDDQLDEDAMLLLGMLFGKYTLQREPQTFWELERTLSGKLNEFRLSISVTRLRERAFICDETVNDMNGEWTGLAVTDAGVAWANRHSDSIAALINRTTVPTSRVSRDFDEEVPF